jgi:hypothetical protein
VVLSAIGSTAAQADTCGNFSCFILHTVTPISTATPGTWVEWMLAPYNGDGQPDLWGIYRPNATSGFLEIHVLSAASNYKTFVLHVATGLPAPAAADFADWQLGSLNGDGNEDLFGIKTNHTQSGSVEVDVLNQASGYKTFAFRAASGFATADAPNFAKWRLAQFGGDGQPDLYGVKTRNTGSGFVEVYVASAGSNYASFLLHARTVFSQADAPNFADWQLNGFYFDGQSDLYGIKTKNTGSGHVEIHVAAATSNYGSFLLHASTAFGVGDAPNMAGWPLSPVSVNGTPNSYAIKIANTPSNDMEVHATGGPPPASPNCSTFNNCTPQTFARAVFATYGINAPVTTSNEYAFEVWQRAEGGGAGCPGQPPHLAPWPRSAGPAGNPINTTQPEPGSTLWNAVGVRIFKDFQNHTCWYWGIRANTETLLNGFYPNIILALLHPLADSRSQCFNLARAVGNSPWGTGNFSAHC